MRIIGNAEKAREVQAVASGTLSTGDTVIVNADGTVTAVQLVTTNIDQAFGSETNFVNAETSYYVSSAFDSTNNKIVIAYQDANDNKGYCVVGTIASENSTTITFGTPVAISTSTLTWTSVSFDTNSGKFAVFYNRSGSGYGKVGTISGTSISFGSESSTFWSASTVSNIASVFDPSQNVFLVAHTKGSDSANVRAASISGTSLSWGSASQFDSNPCADMAFAYNPDNQNVMLIYRDPGTSNYGKALTCTQSGTSITKSSNQYVYNSGYTTKQSVVYDTNANKFLINYQDLSNSNKGTSIVATASGSGLSASFSFGSETVFADYSATYVSSAFDSNVNKCVVFYEESSTGRGYVALGTISGTSVTFATPVPITADGTSIIYTTAVFDSNSKVVVCSFGDFTDTAGTSVVFRNASSTTEPNLTSENFIGTATTSTPDGNAVKINIKGAVDENQSGLTAGQSYYVQTDGTLNTTAGNPSVFAGTAVAANKLIVKG